MDTQKFYTYVRTIASDDSLLAESIIAGHQSIYEPEALTEGFRDVAHKFKQGAKGAAMAAAIAAGGAHAGGTDVKPPIAHEQVKIDPSDIMNTANKFIKTITNDLLETDDFDIMKLDSFKNANKYYANLLQQDQGSANLFARVMNATLKKQLGIAPSIGQQMAN